MLKKFKIITSIIVLSVSLKLLASNSENIQKYGEFLIRFKENNNLLTEILMNSMGENAGHLNLNDNSILASGGTIEEAAWLACTSDFIDFDDIITININPYLSFPKWAADIVDDNAERLLILHERFELAFCHALPLEGNLKKALTNIKKCLLPNGVFIGHFVDREVVSKEILENIIYDSGFKSSKNFIFKDGIIVIIATVQEVDIETLIEQKFHLNSLINSIYEYVTGINSAPNENACTIL